MSAEQKSVTSTLAAIRPQAPAPESHGAVVKMGFETSLGFELLQRGAKLLAASTLVPKDYIGNIPNCVIALNMAARLGADPLLVAQNLYVVHGRPAWSAQFLIATFNQCGRFAAIRYKWTGTEGKDDWGCQAYALEKETGETITGPLITIALAKKEGWHSKIGSKWQTIPQLMLMYRAAAWLVRTHAPELSMGLQSAEEVHDVYDASRGSSGEFAVDMDTLRAADVPAPAAASPMSASAALQVIREAGDLETLNSGWKDITESFTAAAKPIPLDIEAARNERREQLQEGGE